MGDRANFGFRQSNENVVFLYGHWAGHGMLEKLADAVTAARPRWTDESYATRIAISHLVGEDWNQELGWGLHLKTKVFSMSLVDFCTKYSQLIMV
jgi:hypothetical protein